MNYDLPKAITINGETHAICRGCDYRIVLRAMSVLNNLTISELLKIKSSLYIFYQDVHDRFESSDNLELDIVNWNLTCDEIDLYIEMRNIISCGEKSDDLPRRKRMDWDKDWHLIAPPISRVLGYDVRDPDKYTHWYTLIGAYGEIGDCYWAQVMSVRNKRANGKPLGNIDRQFYKEHKKDIDLPMELSEDEKEWLDSDW